jgi:hypothetical protein
MSKGESRFLFRARVGVEKGRVIKSFNWTWILQVNSNELRLFALSPHSASLRSTFLALLGIIPALGLIPAWRYLSAYFSNSFPSWFYIVWVLFFIVVLIGGVWFLGILGVFYFVDLLTMGLQARHARQVVLLELKEVRMGRFRHTLRVSVGSEIMPLNFKGGDFLLTVVSRRQKINSALTPLISPSPSLS